MKKYIKTKMGSYTIDDGQPEPPKVKKVKKSPKRRGIPEHIEQGIIGDMTLGQLSQSEMAKKWEVGLRTVSRCITRFKATLVKVANGEPVTDSREVMHLRLRKKAYVAVEAGLDCTDDQYKRGNLGAKVLEGVGDFKSGEVVVNNFTLMARTPAEFRGRYLAIESGTTGLPDSSATISIAVDERAPAPPDPRLPDRV